MTELGPIDLVNLSWKAVATACLIIGAGRAALTAGPVITSILISLPVNVGPGLFFISFSADDKFISDAALVSFSALGAILGFCCGYAHAAKRLPYIGSLLVAAAIWWAWAYLASQSHMTLYAALAWAGGGSAIAYLLRRRTFPKFEKVAAPAGWKFLIVRGFIAGLVVATISTLSPLIGAQWSGFLLGFPTTLATSAWMLQGHYGQDFTAATINSAQRSMAIYGSFCISAYFLSGPLSGTVAVLVSFAISVVLAAGSAAFIGYRQRQKALIAQQQSWGSTKGG